MKGTKGQMKIFAGLAIFGGLIFLFLLSLSFITNEYGDALGEDSEAYNVSEDLNQEISSRTPIVGATLTIILVGMIISVLIGSFVLKQGF